MDAQLHRPLIMIVDEEIRTSGRLALMLREDAFQTEVFSDGAAAMARLSIAPRPDVIITDLYGHTIGGMAVARFARSQSGQIPVIVTTSYPNFARGAPNEFDPPLIVLTKPILYRNLYELLTRLSLTSA